MLTKLRTIKFVSRWSVGIIVDLVGLYYTRSALIALVLASIAFFLTKFVMGLWTTPLDEYYDAIRSGKPEQIKAAEAWMDALEKGDKVAAKEAYDALAKAIREGKREAISTSIAFSRIQLQQRRSYICEAQYH